MGVVAEDDEGDAFSLGEVQEFAGAGDGFFGVEVRGASCTVTGEGGLQGNGVDGEEDRSGFVQVQQDRLVTGDVSAGFDEGEAGDDLCITFDEAIVQLWIVPDFSMAFETRVSTTGDFILLTLDDKFGVGEGVMVASMVNVKMGADEDVNVAWLET